MISFYLEGVPRYDGTVRVLEFFRFKVEDTKIDTIGHVDEDIKKENPKEYAAFAALVAKQDEALYAECRANPGVPVYAKEIIVKVEVIEEKTEDSPVEPIEEAPAEESQVTEGE